MSEWIKGNRYLTETEMQNNAKIIYNYLIGKGWTINAISGMLGNMERESTINPAIWQSLNFGNVSGGYGLVQWTPSTNYTTWANNKGYDITNGYYQLQWIDEETTPTGQWKQTDAYNFSFDDFKKSTKSVEELASAFLKNFERAGVEVEEERRTLALKWFNFLSENENSTQQKIIQNAIEWCVAIANDDSHGYDQSNRWGVDYDCSSLIIEGYEQAGCPVKTNGATYTGNMVEIFVSTGFEKLSYYNGISLVAGDVLWRDGHTEMYIGDGQRVGAHINENGETTGGQTGDQTGNEISVENFSSSENWTYVLRLTSETVTPDPEPDPNPEPVKVKKMSKFLLYASAIN